MEDREEDAIVAATLGTERLIGKPIPQDEAEWMELMLRKLALPPLREQ